MVRNVPPGRMSQCPGELVNKFFLGGRGYVNNQESAEIVGLQALGWLASNEELMPVFLGATGASMSDVRTQASDPAFLGAVLDFLMQDDAWIVAFCEAAGLAPTAAQEARQALPGGAQTHWT